VADQDERNAGHGVNGGLKPNPVDNKPKAHELRQCIHGMQMKNHHLAPNGLPKRSSGMRQVRTLPETTLNKAAATASIQL
jgi:hypothetical protein